MTVPLYIFGRLTACRVAYELVGGEVLIHSIRRDGDDRDLKDYVTRRQLRWLIEQCRAEWSNAA